MCRGISTPTIDTGIDLDHINSPDDVNPSANSRFYICADCAMEMARMVSVSRNIEFVTAGVVSGLNDSNQTIADSNVRLTERIEELESALRVVNSIPAVPKESPVKKSFKVAAPNEVEI